MRDIIDISVPLHADMPIWPGSHGFARNWTQRLETGDDANVSRLDCDVHVGTHVDAPLHFVDGAAAVDELDLEALVGLATVAFFPEAAAVSADALEALDLAKGTDRLLLRTRNSALWAAGVTEFRPDFVALTADAAQWIVERGIRLIGVDYLSVQRFQDGPEVHHTLLGAGIVVVEGLDLSTVEQGEYELMCLPLKLVGAEGAPARAVLRALAGKEMNC